MSRAFSLTLLAIALIPSVSVDATNPAHVAFTIAGLEGDEARTMIFTDSSGRRDVAGNVITVDPPLNLGEGSANGSTGAIQLPTLLRGYTTKPSWNVAGVNYAVGINAGVTLKDPLPNGSLAPALVALGGLYDDVNHIINFTGPNANNAVISGWDFSLRGGLGIHVGTANNVIIRDDNFVVGSNNQTPIDLQGGAATNIVVEYNYINGNGTPKQIYRPRIDRDEQSKPNGSI